MAQFDVYRLADGALVLDCQSDVLDSYQTRLVVPLLEYDPAMILMSRLHPRFTVDGEQVVMITQFATAIQVRELRRRVASLAEHRLAITDAIDILIGTA